MANWTCQLSNTTDTENHGSAGRGGNFPYAPVPPTLLGKRHWRTTSTGWGRLTGTHSASPGKRTQLSASKLCHKSAWKVGLPYINKMAFYRMEETTTAARRLPHLRRGKRHWRTLTCGGGRWTGVVRLFQEVACKNWYAITSILQSPTAHRCAHHRGKVTLTHPWVAAARRWCWRWQRINIYTDCFNLLLACDNLNQQKNMGIVPSLNLVCDPSLEITIN